MSCLKETGIEALRRGDAALALRYLSAAYREHPDDPETLNYLGVACGKLNMLDRAIGCLREGVRLAPRSPELRYNLGLALWESDDLEGAIGAFERALELDPQHERARRALGRLARGAIRSTAAAELFLVGGAAPAASTENGRAALPAPAGAAGGRLHRWQLSFAAAVLLLVGVVIGQQLGGNSAPADRAAALAGAERGSEPSAAERTERAARDAIRSVRQLDGYFRRLRTAVERVIRRGVGRERAIGLANAYLSAVAMREAEVERAFPERAVSPLADQVRARLHLALGSYEDAGSAWLHYLRHRDPFWRREAVDRHAEAQRQLEAVSVLVGWEARAAAARGDSLRSAKPRRP